MFVRIVKKKKVCIQSSKLLGKIVIKYSIRQIDLNGLFVDFFFMIILDIYVGKAHLNKFSKDNISVCRSVALLV